MLIERVIGCVAGFSRFSASRASPSLEDLLLDLGGGIANERLRGRVAHNILSSQRACGTSLSLVCYPGRATWSKIWQIFISSPSLVATVVLDPRACFYPRAASLPVGGESESESESEPSAASSPFCGGACIEAGAPSG